MENRNVIIIGAGPAGLAAALGALKQGARVLMLEHKEEAGLKLLLTGNGQCNLSNTEVGPEHYHGNKDVIASVISSFSYETMIEFMRELGVETEECKYRFEDCGYLYPADHKASTVRDGLLKQIIDSGGTIITGCNIQSILHTGEKYILKTDSEEYQADGLVFATGSNAYPKTGSDSSIYPILKSLGIIQKKWLPALTALRSDSVLLKKFAGLRADADVVLENIDTGEKFSSKFGEIQFREHYISGLPVINISRYASIGIHNGEKLVLHVTLKKANNKDYRLPCKCADFNITGTEGFDHSICCSGGIDEMDIDSKTLECKKHKNIYFAGEMIDVDGDCGGFNLHFAIASGLIAGRNAAG